MIQTLLIANRGEIARRIARTCREMGIRTIAVYSDADRELPFVREADLAIRLGPAPAAESYLNGGKLLAIALGNGVDAIHPGYGFLAENPEFSEACAGQGIRFVGPPAGVIRAMGDKAEAKRRMIEAGVPVIPGYQGEAQDEPTLRAEAERVGFPVLLKAVAGGGGRGIRLVTGAEALGDALESARREAENAFGDGRVMIEKYLAGPHHVEFQVLADTHGTVLHLYERECSVQRRHQKIVEETPSPVLTPQRRETMAAAAVQAARAIGYVGAGTVEFLVDEDGAFYFLEMNTRLQVEHPITELTLGVDLVRLQIEVAEGQPLSLTQSDLRPRGHAIECRLNAENPAADFLPSAGPLHTLVFPEGPGLRVDAGFVSGSAVSPYYDSLLAKLVAWGGSRPEALRRMKRLLAETRIAGIPTNLSLLQGVMDTPAFIEGRYTTRFVEEHEASLVEQRPPDRMVREQVLAAAAVDVWLEVDNGKEAGGATHNGVPHAAYPGTGCPTGTDRLPALINRRYTLHGEGVDVQIRMQPREGSDLVMAVSWNGGSQTVCYRPESGHGVSPGYPGRGQGVLELDEVLLPLRWEARNEQRWLTLRGAHVALTAVDPAVAGTKSQADEATERLKAPLPGKVIKLNVRSGEAVRENQVLLVMEAMKVEHTITAPFAGTVTAVLFNEGEQVNRDEQLVELEPSET